MNIVKQKKKNIIKFEKLSPFFDNWFKRNKSISTVMDQSFLKFTMKPTDSKMTKSVSEFNVEETALDGFVEFQITHSSASVFHN